MRERRRPPRRTEGQLAIGIDLEIWVEKILDTDRILAIPAVNEVVPPGAKIYGHPRYWTVTTIRKLATPWWGGSPEAIAANLEIVEAVRDCSCGTLTVLGDNGPAEPVEMTDETFAAWRQAVRGTP